MNPETTQKLTARSPQDPHAPENRWQTPPPIFAQLQAIYGPFDLDMTADAGNHLLPQWVGPGSTLENDILAWLTYDLAQGPHHRGYSNPIYDWRFVNAFVPLCAEAAATKGFASTLLLPLRTTSDWWQFLLENQRTVLGAAHVDFCDRRICFYEDGHPRWNAKELAKGKYRPDSAVFDSVVVHFTADTRQAHHRTNFGTFAVPPHVPKAVRTTL